MAAAKKGEINRVVEENLKMDFFHPTHVINLFIKGNNGKKRNYFNYKNYTKSLFSRTSFQAEVYETTL